MALIVCFIETI